MKMLIKYKIILPILIITVGALAGCKKWMDVQPRSEISIDQAFENLSNATSTVLGAYDALSGDNAYGTRLPHHYANDNDETMTSGNLDNGRRGLGRYDLRAGNSELERPFNQLYDGLEKANLCVEQLPLLIARSQDASETDKKQMRRLYGEALVLRAQYLFELMRIWGDVPAPMEPAYRRENLYVPKSNRDTVYAQLIADLAIAKDNLPWRTEVLRDERITKGAAMALRARMALFRGGYALRRETGTMQRRSDYLQYYQIARDECAELMQNRNQHTLNPDYENIWKTISAGQLDPFGEILFEVGMSGGNSSSDSKLGRYDGPRIDANSKYGQAGGGIEVLPTYFYLFDSVDTRRDVTVTLYSINADNTKSPRRLGEINNGKFRRDWRQPILPGNSQFLGYNWPIIRFSDVLLMFAEADNEINNGPSGAAIAAFEEVRKRGFKGHEAQIGTTPTSKAGFFNALVKERSLEFGSEAIRKWDLIRWNLLGTKLQEAHDNLEMLGNQTGPYANVPYYMYYKRVGEDLVWYSSFYTPSPSSTPAGWSRVDWAKHVGSRTIDNLPYYMAPGRLFEANKNELYPFPQATLDSYSGLLTQDYGY